MYGNIVSGQRRQDADVTRSSAERVAAGFKKIGISNGDRIAVLLRNDIPFIEAIHASNILGALSVPINWHSSPEEIAYVLHDCSAKAIVAHVDLWRGIAMALERLGINIPVILVSTPVHIAKAYGVSLDNCTVSYDELDWSDFGSNLQPIKIHGVTSQSPIIYTSGTTGKPKGVIRHGPSDAMTKYYNKFFDPSGTLLLSAPTYHSAPNRFCMMCYRAGGSIVFQTRFDAEETLRLIEEYKVSDIFMVPTMFNRLISLSDEVKIKYDITSLKRVVTAGAPCSPEIKKSMIDWWGPIIYEYYGSTELGLISYCSSYEAIEKTGTVGKPVDEARLRILDDDMGDCPKYSTGEIYAIRDDIPDFDYLNRHSDRLSIEYNGLIASGDVGYIDDDGYLYITDRKKDMIISGGVNIYSAEIEAAMLTFDGLSDCAVFGIPDSDLGEVVVAAVELEGRKDSSEQDLRTYLKGKIGNYKIPRKFFFYHRLPRDESGKIPKHKLRAIHSDV